MSHRIQPRWTATPSIGSSPEPKLWKLSSIPARLHASQVLARTVCSPRPSFVPTKWNYASESAALLRYGSTCPTLPSIGLLASSVTSERRTLSLTGGPWLLRPLLANRQSVKPFDRRVQRPAFVFILSPKGAVRVAKTETPDSERSDSLEFGRASPDRDSSSSSDFPLGACCHLQTRQTVSVGWFQPSKGRPAARSRSAQ
jgi:hypothetical protein